MTEPVLDTLVCEIHGPFAAEPFYGQRCPKCVEQQRERKEALDELNDRFEWTDIPRRYWHATFESFVVKTAAQQEALDIARDYAWHFCDHWADARCLTFAGPPGTGKTHLGCAVISAITRTEFVAWDKANSCPCGDKYRAKYITASEIIHQIRDTWRADARTSTGAMIESFAKVGLLVMDEVGASAGTESERAHLYEIIDLRYRKLIPTVVITNCDQQGLTRVLGDRAVDRLRDRGGRTVIFDWPSYRK